MTAVRDIDSLPLLKCREEGLGLAFTLDFKRTFKIKRPFVNVEESAGPNFPSGDTAGGHKGI